MMSLFWGYLYKKELIHYPFYTEQSNSRLLGYLPPIPYFKQVEPGIGRSLILERFGKAPLFLSRYGLE